MTYARHTFYSFRPKYIEARMKPPNTHANNIKYTYIMYYVYRHDDDNIINRTRRSVMIYNERIIHLIACSGNAKTKYYMLRHSHARRIRIRPDIQSRHHDHVIMIMVLIYRHTAVSSLRGNSEICECFKTSECRRDFIHLK